MHRSRIGVVLIDHPHDSYPEAAAFWARARGGEQSITGEPRDDDPYESLAPLPGGVMLELQRTGPGAAPRVHLDIETDDVAAEVRRLEDAGARVQERHEVYVVMTDPGGVVFCVVPVQTGSAFEEYATTWP